MRILYVTSEAYPLIKTGGLADVSGSLPAAIKGLGADIRILLPGYPQVLENAFELDGLGSVEHLPVIGKANLLSGLMPDTEVPVIIIDSPTLYQREGGPYLNSHGLEWEDNALRFGILSRVAALLADPANVIIDWSPDIVHCNDWQSGLAPAYMHFMKTHARSLISVHNLAFQGCFPSEWVEKLWLPWESYQIDGIEYHNQLSFLKAGLYYADAINTVSPTYAREIRTSELGFGMEGLLAYRQHDLEGILNGIDLNEWNPATDANLPFNYDSDHLEDKQRVKTALQERSGLKVMENAPLLGVVSRLTHQKGLDMLTTITNTLLQRGCQIVLLGSGEHYLEEEFRRLVHDFPGQISVTIGYDESYAHHIMAGSDIFIMPSRFEPCGLNQMYGLRYGTPPVVTHTGGLADTVIDTTDATIANGTANGFTIPTADAVQLLLTIERALRFFQDKKTWRQIQRNGMKLDLGWERSAKNYWSLYQRILNKKTRRLK